MSSSAKIKGLLIGMLIYAIYLIFKEPIVAFVQPFIAKYNLGILFAFLKFGLLYIAMVGLCVFIADKSTKFI